MRASSLVSVCFLVLLWATFGPRVTSAEENANVDDLLLEAFTAERAGGDSSGVAEKFEAVLKKDPENYYALIKMGLLKMQDRRRGSKNSTAWMDAASYFLRAALARPHSPEAHLYLAQMYYRMGYVSEGDQYVGMSRSLDGNVSYDDVCLTGWRYEDTGNYFAAVLTYARAALSRDSQFREDPFLIKRLFASMVNSPPPYDWAIPVLRVMVGDKNTKRIVTVLNQVVSSFLGRHPRLAGAHRQQFIINALLSRIMIAALEQSVKMMDNVPERHELPTVMYKHFFCSPDEIPRQRYSDPYEAFANSFSGTPQEHARVLADLRELREKALAAIAGIPDEEKRADKLFAWLKKNVLTEYHAIEGASAKGLVQDTNRKYQCLTGSILYTLLARDANLDVKGFIVPGHAYAVLDKGRRIRVETTSDGPEGFDYNPEKTAAASREKDKTVYRTPFEAYGAIPEPAQLISYQFRNSALISLETLILYKYERLLGEVLKTALDLDEVPPADKIDMFRRTGTADFRTKRGYGGVSIHSLLPKLILTMAVRDAKFREDVTKEIDASVEMMKRGRGLSPFDRSFRNTMDGLIGLAAKCEYGVSLTAMQERRNKRLVSQAGNQKPENVTASSPSQAGASAPGAESETTVQEKMARDERQQWGTEKIYWLRGVRRLSDGVKQYPCSESLKGELKRVHQLARNLAREQDDWATVEALDSSVRGLSL